MIAADVQIVAAGVGPVSIGDINLVRARVYCVCWCERGRCVCIWVRWCEHTLILVALSLPVCIHLDDRLSGLFSFDHLFFHCCFF
jgi:hypothetical protein